MPICPKCGFEEGWTGNGHPDNHVCDHRAFRGSEDAPLPTDTHQLVNRQTFGALHPIPNDTLAVNYRVQFVGPGSARFANQTRGTIASPPYNLGSIVFGRAGTEMIPQVYIATQFTSEKRCSYCSHNYHNDNACAMACKCPSSFEKFLQDDGLTKVRQSAFRGME